MGNLLQKRFDELSTRAREIEASQKPIYDSHYEKNKIEIDYNDLLKWQVNAKALIDAVCGSSSQHAKHLDEASERGFGTSLGVLKKMAAVFEAAKEDYEGGYLVSMRNLVQSEVFDSELEQSTELLKGGYSVAAAVIAGTVLETCLRDLCTRNQIPHATADKMNADLVKAGAYNVVMQKRITHLQAVRNSAAHGNKDEFATYDVAAMIDEISRFLSQHFT